MEAKTSTLQAEVFSHMAAQMTYRVDRGPSERILFPKVGPYDRRLGYVGLPGFVAALGGQGFEVESQARISQQFEWYFKRSGIAPYREKTQAGLALVRSEEHTSELQSLMRISYAVFCLKKKKDKHKHSHTA